MRGVPGSLSPSPKGGGFKYRHANPADPGLFDIKMVTKYFCMFTANLGDMIQFDEHIFSKGLVQPQGKFVGMLLAYPTEGWFRLREPSEILWIIFLKFGDLKRVQLEDNSIAAKHIPNWRNATIWCKATQMEENDFMIVEIMVKIRPTTNNNVQ